MPLLITRGLGAVVNPTTLTLASITPAQTTLTLAFSSDVAIINQATIPSNYGITTTAGLPSSVTSVIVSGGHIILGITRQTDATQYTLSIPTLGITDLSGNPFNGAFINTYTAVGVPLAVQMARSVDARTLDVIFSVPVDPIQAGIVSNYSINNGLMALSVARVTDEYYTLTTTKQTPDQSYTVSITNIVPLV